VTLSPRLPYQTLLKPSKTITLDLFTKYLLLSKEPDSFAKRAVIYAIFPIIGTLNIASKSAELRFLSDDGFLWIITVNNNNMS
jgi:hypothetical protein